MKSPIETPAAVDWSRARALLGNLESAVRLSLVLQILVGREADSLKGALGFAGKGNNRGPEGQFVLTVKSWNQWCLEELKVSSKTVDRWIGCYHGAVERAKKVKAKCPEALLLLQADPASTSEAHTELLAEHVALLLTADLYSNTDGTHRESLQCSGWWRYFETAENAVASSRRGLGDGFLCGHPAQAG